jgi:hypothetical protein
MPGIPSHFKTLELALQRMGGVPAVAAARNTMQQHPEWAHLGALGPALADFIPGSRAENPLLDIWSEVFGLIGDNMRVTNGLLGLLHRIQALLAELDPIIAAEDLSALQALGSDKLDLAKSVGDDLKAIFDQIPFIVLPIGSGIISKMRPHVNVPVGTAVPPSQFWELRNLLSWKKTGAFTANLYRAMRDSGDDRFLAYAYGYALAYVLRTVGGPFVASSVRGPYRTQWWRYRWVSNYVDAWIWGNYEAGAVMGASDEPNPPYAAWPNLCQADLHQRIALGQHDENDLMVRLFNGQPLSDAPILPPEFGELWITAFQKTYDPAGTSLNLTPSALNDAYLMTWLVLWFQTASDGLGCNNPPDLTPPTGCSDKPPWVDLVVSGDSSAPQVPVPDSPEIEADPDVGEIISGILLGLLGLGVAATGGVITGGFLIGQGITDIIEGANQINWAKLRCYVHWYRIYLYHALDALDEILVATTFRYPKASALGVDRTMPQYFSSFLDPYDSGKNITRSYPSDGKDRLYPAAEWSGGFDWVNPPTSFESPYTVGYRTQAYPTFFVDAAANPLANGLVREPGLWPVRTDATPSGTVVTQFGNAVDNVIDLLQHVGEPLPDWNLDADRGLAYHTWDFQNGIRLDPVAIGPDA